MQRFAAITNEAVKLAGNQARIVPAVANVQSTEVLSALADRTETLEISLVSSHLQGTRGCRKKRAALSAAGIAENRRAETLTMQEFADLANEVVKLAGK